MNSLPEDPIDVLDENAIGIHMIYESYLRAGFTNDEAMAIVVAIVQESMRMVDNEK